MSASMVTEIIASDSLTETRKISIPFEVQLRILRFLSKKALDICLQVSSGLRSAILSTRYRHRMVYTRGGLRMVFTRGGLFNLSYYSNLNELDIIKFIPQPRDPNPFINTTHLTFPAHPKSWCSSVPHLIMPNLNSLKLDPDSHKAFPLDLCNSRAPSWIELVTSSHLPPTTETEKINLPCCSLLLHLRPESIELGDKSTSINGDGNGLWTSAASSFPPPWLKYITLNTGSGSSSAAGFWPSLTATVRKLILVLPDKVKSVDKWRWKGGKTWWREYKRGWVRVALAMSGMAQEVEIVGTEGLGKEWRDLSVDELRSKATEILLDCLVEKAKLSKAAAEKRVERVIFTRFEDNRDRQQVIWDCID